MPCHYILISACGTIMRRPDAGSNHVPFRTHPQKRRSSDNLLPDNQNETTHNFLKQSAQETAFIKHCTLIRAVYETLWHHKAYDAVHSVYLITTNTLFPSRIQWIRGSVTPHVTWAFPVSKSTTVIKVKKKKRKEKKRLDEPSGRGDESVRKSSTADENA